MLFLFTVSFIQALSLFLGVASILAIIIAIVLMIVGELEDIWIVWIAFTSFFTVAFSILYFSIKAVLFGLGVV